MSLDAGLYFKSEPYILTKHNLAYVRLYGIAMERIRIGHLGLTCHTREIPHNYHLFVVPQPKGVLQMAHEVLLDINNKFVLHKDVKVEVKTDKGKLGTLLISKGNIEWLPTGNSVNKHRLTWTKFAELMETQGKPAKAK